MGSGDGHGDDRMSTNVEVLSDGIHIIYNIASCTNPAIPIYMHNPGACAGVVQAQDSLSRWCLSQFSKYSASS